MQRRRGGRRGGRGGNKPNIKNNVVKKQKVELQSAKFGINLSRAFKKMEKLFGDDHQPAKFQEIAKKHHQNRKEKADVKLYSKPMIWLLRHGLVEKGLEYDAQGFVQVTKMLIWFNENCPQEKDLGLDDIKKMVKTSKRNGKPRFELKTKEIDSEEIQFIRAITGHSVIGIAKEENTVGM